MAERKRTLEVYDGQQAANGRIPTAPTYNSPTVNPYTGRPYSTKYYDILSKRKGALLGPPTSPSGQSHARPHACMQNLRLHATSINSAPVSAEVRR